MRSDCSACLTHDRIKAWTLWPIHNLSRIVINPDVRSGRPCARDTRVTVQEILRWLASGATEDEILSDYPYLDRDDFKLVFASVNRPK